MIPPDTADVAGWAGALTLVGAYYAASIGLLRSDARGYQVMNLVGSLGLGAVAWAHRTWPSLALNSLWLLIAVVTLRRTFARTAARPNRSQVHPRTSRPRHPSLITPHTEQGAPPCPTPPSFPPSPTSP